MGTLHQMISPQEVGLVRKIAAEVFLNHCRADDSSSICREELYHLGIIGLVETRPKFDHSRGVPWLSFAAFRVRGAMLDHLRKLPQVRLPVEKSKKLRQLREVTVAFQKAGDDPDPKVLGQKLGWSLKEVHEVQNLALSLVPASATDQRLGFDRLNHEVVIADPGCGPEKKLLREELVLVIRRCLAGLSDQHRMILLARVLEGVKLRILADSLACSMENVRQQQKGAEAGMRRCMEKNGWSDENFLEGMR